MPLVTRLPKVAKPAAGKAIDALIKAWMLVSGECKRGRAYSYQPYMGLLK